MLNRLVTFQRLILGAAVWILVSGTGLERVNAQEPVPVKMATLAPLNTPWMSAWDRTKELVAEQSPVPLKLTAYAGGVMGDEPDMVRKMKFGQLQMVGLTVIGLSKLVPETLVLALPYLYESEDEVNHILTTFHSRFQDYAKERDLKLLQIGADESISAFSQHLIETREDMEQRKYWLWTADPIGTNMIENLGLQGVSLGVPEVRVGLQTGMIDTIFGSPLIVVALQWQPYVKYYYPATVAFGVGGLVARGDFLKDVPEKHRAGVEKVIVDALETSRSEMAAESESVNRDMLQRLTESGLQVVDSDSYQKLMDEIGESAKEVWANMVGEFYPQSLLDEVVAELQAYRAAQK